MDVCEWCVMDGNILVDKVGEGEEGGGDVREWLEESEVKVGNGERFGDVLE